MGKPCRVTFGERVFFKPDFVKRFLDTLHLEDDVVENSTYLKSIGYDNAFNEGDPMLIREKKAEAKAEAKAVKPILSKNIDVESSDGRKGLVPTSELEEFIGEDRLGEAQMATSRETIDRLKEDIAKNGFKEPIVIVYDKFSGEGEATIIEGNHRIIAAKELGLTEVPVTFEKGTIRDNESRVKDKMFPIKRKTVGKLNDTRGVKGADLGLTVRQPTEADFVEAPVSTPQAKEEAQAKVITNDDVKLKKGKDFSMDGVYNVMYGDEVIGRIYYDRSSFNAWVDNDVPPGNKGSYSGYLGTKEEAIQKMVDRYNGKQATSTKQPTPAAKAESKNISIGGVSFQEATKAEKELLGKGIKTITLNGEDVGAINIQQIDDENNVVSSVFIQEGQRKKGIAKKAYIIAALENGDVKSGEFRDDMSKTSFVSNEARKLWESLGKDFNLDKIKIDGDKFRYSLTKKSIIDTYNKSKADGSNPELVKALDELLGEQTKAEPTIFDDLDATNKRGGIKDKVAANKAFAEKHGEDAAVAKAISSNFEAIADELKAKGIFTKIEC